MKQLSSADFRKAYASETEPVEVTSYGKAIGRWYPSGFDLSAADLTNPSVAVADPAPIPQRMTIRPVKANPRGPLTGTPQRIIDPIERTEREREVWAQLQAKMLPQSSKR
jgi:hypothetical protein